MVFISLSFRNSSRRCIQIPSIFNYFPASFIHSFVPPFIYCHTLCFIVIFSRYSFNQDLSLYFPLTFLCFLRFLYLDNFFLLVLSVLTDRYNMHCLFVWFRFFLLYYVLMLHLSNLFYFIFFLYTHTFIGVYFLMLF